MQTSTKAKLIDLTKGGFGTGSPEIPDPNAQIKRLKISEFKSWTACFAVISLLTGLLIYLKVGVTMETVTASLFFLSLIGLAYSVIMIIKLSGEPSRFDSVRVHELN